MVEVVKHGVILRPTRHEFENQAVLNPSCVQKGNKIHLFYRAVRKGNYSSIGYCLLEGPLKVVKRKKKPLLFPELSFESHGIEDPRIVKLNNTYYLFYAAYDGKNCVVAYATSKNLFNWKKKGIISATVSYDEVGDILRKYAFRLKEKYLFFDEYIENTVGQDVMVWEKDAFIFPKKLKGNFVLVHRVLPEIQVAYFKKFKELNENYWRRYFKKIKDYVLLEPSHDYESRNIGAGTPMIETERGWLMIYHAVQDTNYGKIYHASAALFDKNDPTKLIGKLVRPLFSPTENYEKMGDTNNVVFPTGTAIFGDRLYIYYGAADKCIAVASVNLYDLIDELDPKNTIPEIAKNILPYLPNCYIEGDKLINKTKYSKKMFYTAIGHLAKEGLAKITFMDGKAFVKRINPGVV